MAFDSTITEQDMDASARQFLQGLNGDSGEADPDLAVDGLSDSVLSRLFAVLGIGKS